MIPMQRFTLEKHSCKHCKDDKSYHFLNHLQLHQRKRAAVADKSDAVRRYLT